MPRRKKEELPEPEKINPELEVSDSLIGILSEENRKRMKDYASLCVWCEHGQKCGKECPYGIAERGYGRY